MKGLFITHDVSNYGASRSLQPLLRGYDCDIDLVIRKRLIVSRESDEEIRKKFGSRLRNIHWFYLPFDCCYLDEKEMPPSLAVKSAIIKLLWLSNRKKLMRVIAEGGYDFIHLNSLVLHPIITADHPFIIHVREILFRDRARTIKNIHKAKGMIFIDEATRKPFSDSVLPENILLNNPFDMTRVKEYIEIDSPFPGQGLDSLVVFSMIGVLSESKGSEFVISSFKQMHRPHARLIIVGRGEKEYVEHCRKLAEGDHRILFWGEEQDIEKIYALTDYVVRGEAYPCVGRTIYEGLFSGCQTIVPGMQEDGQGFFHFDRFREGIHFYPPRDGDAFLSLLERLSLKKMIERSYHSNVDEYIREFGGFVERCLQK